MKDHDYLFVYGTLRKDTQSVMHRVLSDNSDLIQKGTFRGKLFMFGGYPGVVPSSDPEDIVYGEVYRLKDADSILAILDAYEGCSQDSIQPTEYVRKKVDITLNTESCVKAWIYIFNQSIKGLQRIESGDFLDTQSPF